MNLKDLGRTLHPKPARCGCGGEMVLRTSRAYPNSGDLFWGCYNWQDKTWGRHDSLPFVWQATLSNILETLK